MYIYFDRNGTLREIIQIPVRQGSVEHNKIYVYVDPGTGLEPILNIYHLPSEFGYAKANFKVVDTDVELANSERMTKITGVIPADKNRDLKYFKYGYTYEFWSLTIPSAVTAVNGLIEASVYLYNNSTELALNRFAFNVEASVGVQLDGTITQSNYSYLYNLLSHNEFVPYSGANKNVNIGVYSFTGESFNAENGDDFAGFTAYGIDKNDGLLLFPEITNEDDEETFATQEWVNLNDVKDIEITADVSVPYRYNFTLKKSDGTVICSTYADLAAEEVQEDLEDYVDNAIGDLEDKIEDGTVIAKKAETTAFTNNELVEYEITSQNNGVVTLPEKGFYYIALYDETTANYINFGLVLVDQSILPTYTSGFISYAKIDVGDGYEYWLYTPNTGDTDYPAKVSVFRGNSVVSDGILYAKRIK